MDLYSIRNKDKNLPLIYDTLSLNVRVKISRLWSRITSGLEEDKEETLWRVINSAISDQHGVHELVTGKFFDMTFQDECNVYFENTANLDECFDIIEIVMRTFKRIYENGLLDSSRFRFEDSTSQLNKIFRDSNIGYEYTEGIIIRTDNKLLHQNIIDKTIQLTSNDIFLNANEEFLSALQHLKAERNKEALNDALKSFESTMKIIFDHLQWPYSPNGTAKDLINICIEKELIPKYLTTHFTGIRTTLEAGVGTIRNKVSAHGQGSKNVIVPNSLAIYAVYLAGSCINYLIDLYETKK